MDPFGLDKHHNNTSSPSSSNLLYSSPLPPNNNNDSTSSSSSMISINNNNHPNNNNYYNNQRPPPGLASFNNNVRPTNNNNDSPLYVNSYGYATTNSYANTTTNTNTNTVTTSSSTGISGSSFMNNNNNFGNNNNNKPDPYSSSMMVPEFSSFLTNTNLKGYTTGSSILPNNTNNMWNNNSISNGTINTNGNNNFINNYGNNNNNTNTANDPFGRGNSGSSTVTTTGGSNINDHNFSTIPPGGGQEFTSHQYTVNASIQNSGSNNISNVAGNNNNNNNYSIPTSSTTSDGSNKFLNNSTNFSFPDTNDNYSFNTRITTNNNTSNPGMVSNYNDNNGNNNGSFRKQNNFSNNNSNKIDPHHHQNLHGNNPNYYPHSSNFSGTFNPQNISHNQAMQRSPVKMNSANNNMNTMHIPPSMNNNSNNNIVPDVPAGLVAAPEVQARFCAIQWQLLRLLVLRRYSLQMKNDALNEMNENNLRAAAVYFEIPTHLCSLVSRPRQRLNPQMAFGSNLALAGIRGFSILGNYSNNNNSNNYFGEMEWCDLSHPFVPVSSIHISNLPVQSLTEEALGWYPTDGQTISNSKGSTKSDSDKKDNSLFDSMNESTVNSTDSVQARENAANAVATFAAELVSMRRFKTKLCHSWLRTGGKCPRGNTCDYAHGADELRGALEPHKSGKYKQRVCGVWLDTAGNFCPQADRCSFAHGVHELRVHVVQDTTESQNADNLNGHFNSSDDISLHLATLGAPTVGMPGHSALNLANTTGNPLGNELIGKGSNFEATRYKPSLCLPWLIGTGQAALKAVLSTELALAAGQEKQAQTYMENVRTAGARSCSSGIQCPFAHGLAEARLPTPHEMSRQLSSLLMEGSSLKNNYNPNNPNDLADALSSLQINSSSPSTNTLSPRDHLLIFIASGLITGSLPSVLFNRIREISSSSTVSSPSSTSSSSSVSVPFMDHPSSARASSAATYFGENIPADVQHALRYSAHSPLLRVIIPALSGRTDNNNNNNNSNNNNRMTSSMSRIVTVVGHDAADIAIIGAAIVLNLIPVQIPLPLVHGLNIHSMNEFSSTKNNVTNSFNTSVHTFTGNTNNNNNNAVGHFDLQTPNLMLNNSTGYLLPDNNNQFSSMDNMNTPPFGNSNNGNSNNFMNNNNNSLNVMGNTNTTTGKNNYNPPQTSVPQPGRYGAFLRRHNNPN